MGVVRIEGSFEVGMSCTELRQLELNSLTWGPVEVGDEVGTVFPEITQLRKPW